MRKTAKKVVRVRTAPKAKAKAAKKSIKAMAKGAKAKKKAAPEKKASKLGSNVIWKFLEMKEARRKELAEQTLQQNKHAASGGGAYNLRNNGYSRFAGPRRRAA